MKLIIGQGNPSDKYTRTRHNIGWQILDSYASRKGAKWKESKKFTALIAKVKIGNEKVLLVKPLTFYNDTGLSARKIIDYYNLSPHTDVLAVHDDLAIPLGTIRRRLTGSPAGNNGIKSLNAHLGVDYARLRIGIYNDLRSKMGDTNFVLANFTSTEQNFIDDKIIPEAESQIELFIEGAYTPHSTTLTREN